MASRLTHMTMTADIGQTPYFVIPHAGYATTRVARVHMPRSCVHPCASVVLSSETKAAAAMDHLYFVIHTHWDREWYEPFQRMRARLVAMTDRMLGLVERGEIPCFHFDGQTIVLEDYLEVRPENAKRLHRLVRAGKIQVGPWYVLADSFLVSGEALIRNLEIGCRIARRFGEPLALGYLPDQFGHTAQMPQILTGFGLKAAIVWRGVGREIDRNRFVWQALDGSEILTLYLPFGYSNGANFPTDSADAVLARAQEIAAREREFACGAPSFPILVMNGTDHTEPDPRLPKLLAELRGRDGFDFEIGTLEEYVKRLAEPPQDGLRRHCGELRSPARAHLLPGVTSARSWIKQRDFQNCYLLERLADPLAAISAAVSSVLGHAEDLSAYLDLAWRMEIQNHPHDSICGCSIDQVHQDMVYRFDQAAMIGELVVRRAAKAILPGDSGGEPALAVFNPTFARRAAVSGEVDIEDLGARYALIDAQGRRIPVSVEAARSERAFDAEIPAADFKRMIGGLSSAEVMGRFVNRFELRHIANNRFKLDLYVSRNALSDLNLADFKRRIAELPDAATVVIHATSAARAGVVFVADELAQAGFSFYRLVREEGPAHREEPPRDAPAGESIENEYYRLVPSARGLSIQDLASGKSFELSFEDDGDRGDEYNFDPVPGSRTIAEPLSIAAHVLERGSARSRLGLSLVYRIPAGLDPRRKARAEAAVEMPIEVAATLYAGFARVDFEVSADNRARDHRIRAALSAPIASAEAISDTSFGIVRRRLDPTEPPGTEDIYPTGPHRTFTAVESTEVSAALMSRGLYEVEVRPHPAGATILLTLLRCVGWLSRADLKTRRGGAGPQMETPGAQELGPHRFEFAITTWRGPFRDSDLLQRSNAYASPPRIFNTRWTPGSPAPWLCECDNPRIVFSTARGAERKGAYIVRLFSSSEQPETARLRFPAGRAIRMVDLAGRTISGAGLSRKRDTSVEVSFRPFQIATFEILPPSGKNFRARGQKD
jgi:2-O-(6-phospho-alpha-D-mannosyl)-D-glycerate hydrolase